MSANRAKVSAIFVGVLIACGPVYAASGERGVSPRAAMHEFLSACRRGDFDEAGAYLDLRMMPARGGDRRGSAVARRFKSLLDRSLWVDVDALSEDPAGDLADGLPPDTEQIGAIDAAGGSIPIALVRDKTKAGRPDWRVSARTLASVQPLLDRAPWIEERLPPILTRPRFLEMAPWQWLALPLLAAIASTFGLVFTRVLRRPLVVLERRIASDDGELVERTRAPMRMLVAAVLFVLLLPTLALSVPAHAASQKVGIAVAAIAVLWLGSRSLDEASRRTVARMAAAGRLDAAGLIPTAARVCKLVLCAIVFVVMAQNFGMDVTGVLAGLGVGGLAVALAAQKTVENLFGGVTLVADRPVQVGDFCRFGDRLGTVEAIGMRSTRIRTLDQTVVTVPNAQFSSLQLENYAARDRIWLNLTLGLRYETDADRLRRLLAALRKLLQDHARVDPRAARVRFVNFGAYSLDLEVFAYILTRDYDEYLAIREEVLLSIMDAVAACGTSFAFPSQTIYAAEDPGLEPVRDREASAGMGRDARSG